MLQEQYLGVSEQLQTARFAEPVLDLLCEDQPLEESCRRLACIIRDYAGADRVSICQSHSGGTRVLAIDPSKSVNQRSEQVQLLQRFAGDVIAKGEDTDFVLGKNQNEILSSLAEYIDVSESRQVHARCCDLPKSRQAAIRGAVVVESFEASDQLARNFQLISDQVLSAINELLRRHDRGARGIIHRLKTTSLLGKVTLTLVTAVFAIAMLFLIPTELRIPAYGHLRPIEVRSVFAPSDGIVYEVHVDHDQAVSSGQVLLSIRAPDLELKRSQIAGEIATLEAQLDSVRAVKSQSNFNRSSTRGSTSGLDRSLRGTNSSLTAEEEDLKIQIEGLRTQLQLVSTYLDDLVVSSPVSGVTDCFEIKRRFENRPVDHGQFLLDVVDSESGWELRIEIEDDLIGYVNANQQQQECRVDFRIRGNPTKSYSSRIEWVANTTQLDERGVAYVLATSDLSDTAIEGPRSGAEVVAEIYCGRKSLGFVWFREIIEYLQKSFLV